MADTDTMDLSGLASNTDDSNVGMPSAGTPPFLPPAGGAEPTPTGVPGPGKSPMATPADVPGNHAKLFGMLAGLGVALSATGKALATHGREGGAQDVAAYVEQQQQEKRAQADQKMKQADFETRQKYMQAQTNALIVKTQTDLQKAPDEIQKAHIDVQNAQIEMYEKAGVPPVVAVAMVQGQTMPEHANNVTTAMQGDVVGNTAIPGHEGEYGSGQGKTNVYSFDQMAKVNIPKDMAAPTLSKLSGLIDVAEASGVDKNVIAAARAKVQHLQGADSVNGRDLFMVSTQVEAPIVNATAAKKAEIDTQTKQAELANKQNEAVSSGVKAKNAAADEALSQQEKRGTIAKNQQELINAKYKNAEDHQKALFNEGVDPITGEKLNLANAPDEALIDGNTGKPIPTKMLATLKPTQQESNRADFAKSALHSLDLIDGLKAQGKLPNGPISGWTTKGLEAAGLNSKDAAEAIGLVALTQSAATGAHVGGRFSHEILDKMTGLLSLNANDSQFEGQEKALRDVMTPYSQQGGRVTVAQYKQEIIGSVQTLKNGTKVQVTGIDKNGNFVGSPVK